jgi:transcriptional regulator with XRE-family HTH domain
MKMLRLRIKKIREFKGITCQYIADRAGISKVEVNRIERGLRDPKAQVLFRISQALEVPFEEIYEIIDAEKPQP